jgi:hypothetical protein
MHFEGMLDPDPYPDPDLDIKTNKKKLDLDRKNHFGSTTLFSTCDNKLMVPSRDSSQPNMK